QNLAIRADDGEARLGFLGLTKRGPGVVVKVEERDADGGGGDRSVVGDVQAGGLNGAVGAQTVVVDVETAAGLAEVRLERAVRADVGNAEGAGEFDVLVDVRAHVGAERIGRGDALDSGDGVIRTGRCVGSAEIDNGSLDGNAGGRENSGS